MTNDMIKIKTFDVRNNTFGHAIYSRGVSEKGNLKVSGCLTPLPKNGDYAVSNKNTVFRFLNVEPMGNPKDGFFAEMEHMGLSVIAEEGELIEDITEDQIMEALNETT